MDGRRPYDMGGSPDDLHNMREAISALIQEPSGCFEQTSSTLYPMIMGMQYLNALPA